MQRTGRKINDQKIIRLYQLYNTNERYPELIPILASFLDTNITDLAILEELTRCLMDKDAKGLVNRKLIEIYHYLPKHYKTERGVIGMALEKNIFARRC